MKKSLLILLWVVVFFGAHYLLDNLYFGELRKLVNSYINQLGISHIITYAILGIPIFLGTAIIVKSKTVLSALGLNKGFLKAMAFAFICTLPMFIGYAIVFDFNREVTLNQILIVVFAAAFFEEVYYRGFLFGMLFRFSRFGFIPSVILGALLFASAHLHQSSDTSILIGIFITTLLGALLFAWVYVEWKYSIWTAIFLHLFMNLSWLLFSAGDHALGGVWSNIFRIATIFLVIAGTIFYKKARGLKLEINKNTLMLKKQ